MRNAATAFLGLMVFAVYAQDAVTPQKNQPAPPKVLQGSVLGFSGSTLMFEFKGDTVSNGRQVDLSAATFEDSAGKTVPKFELKPGDLVLIVLDPTAPATWRPTPRPGQPMPMIIRLMPLKALVIERIDLTSRIWHANG